MTCHTAAKPRIDEEVGRDGTADETGRGGCESPKAKSLEKKMICKVKDTQTKAKISKHFRKFAEKRS